MEEREALARLMKTLERAEPWGQRTRVDEPFVSPGDRSALAGDDSRVHPYQTSQIAWHSLSHAVDHLQMLQAVLRVAKIIHMYSPYSVVRGALENACTAVWLLGPAQRSVRLERRLRFAATDIRAGEEVKDLVGKAGPRSREERLDDVRKIARRHGVDERKALSRLGYREIVRAAAAHLTPEDDRFVQLVYSICSGMAHGDLWPTLSASERVELPGAPVGMAYLEIKPNVRILLYTTIVATDMTEHAWRLYDERCRSPFSRQ